MQSSGRFLKFYAGSSVHPTLIQDYRRLFDIDRGLYNTLQDWYRAVLDAADKELDVLLENIRAITCKKTAWIRSHSQKARHNTPRRALSPQNLPKIQSLGCQGKLMKRIRSGGHSQYVHSSCIKQQFSHSKLHCFNSVNLRRRYLTVFLPYYGTTTYHYKIFWWMIQANLSLRWTGN